MSHEMWPAWVAVGSAALLTINQLLGESEKFANLLGRFGRWAHARAKARRRMDTVEFHAAVRQAVNEERERWQQDEARELRIMEGRLDFVTKITEAQQEQLQELNFEMRCLTSYSEYEAAWHNRLRIMALRAAANGGAIDIETLPHHVQYADFEARCKEEGNLRWKSWGIL